MREKSRTRIPARGPSPVERGTAAGLLKALERLEPLKPEGSSGSSGFIREGEAPGQYRRGFLSLFRRVSPDTLELRGLSPALRTRRRTLVGAATGPFQVCMGRQDRRNVPSRWRPGVGSHRSPVASQGWERAAGGGQHHRRARALGALPAHAGSTTRPAGTRWGHRSGCGTGQGWTSRPNPDPSSGEEEEEGRPAAPPAPSWQVARLR